MHEKAVNSEFNIVLGKLRYAGPPKAVLWIDNRGSELMGKDND